MELIKNLIIGSDGSMGTRYRACLKFMGINFDTYDVKTHTKTPDLDKYDNIMITTPTDTHFGYLKDIIPLNKNILCEKPISKSIDELYATKELLDKSQSQFAMMLQYAYLSAKKDKPGGSSLYNYYKTGNDGLYWDCLQIIHLSKAEPVIANTSPIWTCRLNGNPMSIRDMDFAYVRFLHSWISGINFYYQAFNDLIETHKKVKAYQDEYDKSCNSNSGTIKLN